jgi:hypothetical protein
MIELLKTSVLLNTVESNPLEDRRFYFILFRIEYIGRAMCWFCVVLCVVHAVAQRIERTDEV